MSRTNTSEMAIMGLLALGARTGYEVRQECEERLSHFWAESYGQIYPVLRTLRQRGWVTRSTDRAGGRTRHLYAVTAAGRSALEEWVVSPPGPMRVRNEMLLKVYLGRLVDRKELMATLGEYKAEVERRGAMYRALSDRIRTEAGDAPDAPFWLVTLDFGIRSLAAQTAWAGSAQETLAATDAENV